MVAVPHSAARTTLFLSKATPGDDAFALWIAPRLEAAGYDVFADILCLNAGDRWRRKLTDTLQNKAVKMLLCCSDESLARDGVDEEISIATDISKQIGDPNFIIPLRLHPFKKVFGVGGIQYLDFSDGWAEGLWQLLETLSRQGVIATNVLGTINPEWERYQKRAQVSLERSPESLTTNWMRVNSGPAAIRLFSPTGAINHGTLANEIRSCEFPLAAYNRGFFGFCSEEELESHFLATGRFQIEREFPLAGFIDCGVDDLGIGTRLSKNIVLQLMRLAWERHCSRSGMLRHEFASASSFHVSDKLAGIGQRISWGKQGSHRSSMLRNISKQKVWEFGVTAIPSLYPFPHYRLKSRVLFSETTSTNERGPTISDAKVQHRLRRSICSSWRNPAWHGRLMAFLEMLEPEGALMRLEVGGDAYFCVDPSLIRATSPVTTKQVSDLGGDAEDEPDDTTLPFEAEEGQ